MACLMLFIYLLIKQTNKKSDLQYLSAGLVLRDEFCKRELKITLYIGFHMQLWNYLEDNSNINLPPRFYSNVSTFFQHSYSRSEFAFTLFPLALLVVCEK